MKPLRTSLCVVVLSATMFGQSLNVSELSKPAPGTWPMYNGDYSGRRFSTLKKINDRNVNALSLAWVHRVNAGPGLGSNVSATPVLVDGILYFTVPDHVWAIDARTG